MRSIPLFFVFVGTISVLRLPLGICKGNTAWFKYYRAGSLPKPTAHIFSLLLQKNLRMEGRGHLSRNFVPSKLLFTQAFCYAKTKAEHFILKECYAVEESKNIKLYAFTIDCREPYQLAKFYAELLDWEIPFFNEDWACVGAPGAKQGAYPGIMFQRNPQYQPPVWPDKPDTQQQMAHLDFAVKDLETAVTSAMHCGATMAAQQFSEDWRVMLDPAGHPFCLCQMKPLFESPDFALL